MYQIKNLEDISFEKIADTWNLAFADYIVTTNVNAESVDAYFKMSKVDRSMSFGAYHNDILIGMLLNSIDEFKGSLVAYDAMTGIVPEHRNKGVFSLLFEYAKNNLKRKGITHYYLEVITENKNAYTIYKKIGGKICRELSVIEGRIDCDHNFKVRVVPLHTFPYEDLSKYEPSFSNRIIALRRNVDSYQIAYIENEKAAVIFNKQGGISQIQYDGEKDNERLKAILAYLSQKFDCLRISNIPISETELINTLRKLGFHTLVNQYEMCVEL